MSHCLVSFKGHVVPRWVLEAVADGRVPGVCLFAFNFRDLAQFRELTRSLHEAARAGGQPPPLVGIDQEGGQLMAVSGGATELPGNMALGATRSAVLAQAAGRILGSELAALGVNLNFAPVLDVATQPANPVVGLRAFGDDAGLVGELGAAMVEGMQGEGVLACAKHFPGHGSTMTDSHHAAASVDKSLAELMALELRPFQAAFEAGLAAVMTAHVRYPQLDDVPATFSHVVLGDLLRGRLGFEGLVISDALDMHALADVPGELRARRTLEAGADLAILGHLPAQQEIVESLASASFPEAARRVRAARAALEDRSAERSAAHRYSGDTDGRETGVAPLQGPLPWPRHAAEARAMAQAAITLVGDPAELPLRLDVDERLVVVAVAAGNLTPAETASGGSAALASQLARRHANLDVREFPFGAGDAAARLVDELEAVCEGAKAVVVATIDAASDSGQRLLLRRLVERGHRPVVLALRSPTDAALVGAGVLEGAVVMADALPAAGAARGVRAVICSYGRREEQTDATVAVLFGERPATGRLPLELPGTGEGAPEEVRA